MKEETIFAVVDIEATSGSVGTGEGMIQFACVLYQNGKILETFETLVNPLKKVPYPIQSLTGITQKEVDYAPFFEEIAELIKDLLSNTVFVAHNVAFDFQFLNEQFENIGLAPLDIPAVDTVTLSRILFPKAYSYNLKDLAEWLGYELENAHNALYDAKATVFLFSQLIQKAEELPMITLEKITELAEFLPYKTGIFFKNILGDLKENPKDLSDSLVVVNQIAIKKPKRIEPSKKTKPNYPLTSKEKRLFFGENFKLRNGQDKLMDSLYSYFVENTTNKELAVEAPSGIGKSIGYIFPALLDSNRRTSLVISTYTNVLQEQLFEQAIPLIEKFLPFEISAVIVKGKSHFLSLNQFERELTNLNPKDTEAFFCMQILVWLTETDFGDFEEIGVDINNTHPFWDKVRTKDKISPQNNQHKTYEFYERMLYNANNAEVIITNHAYLNHDLRREEKMLPLHKTLIIDEAHHYIQSLNQTAMHIVKNTTLRNQLKQFRISEKEQTILSKLENFVENNLVQNYQIDALESNSILLEEEWNEFIDSFHDYFTAEYDIEVGWEEVLIEDSPLFMRRQVKRIRQIFEEILFYLQNILEKTEKNIKQLSVDQNHSLDEFFNFTNEIHETYSNFIDIFDFSNENQLRWISFHTNSPENSVRFKAMSTQEKNRLLTKLHDTSKIIYISSTLSVNHSISFFEKQIKAEEIEFLPFSSPYEYNKQVKLLVPNELKSIKRMSNKQYIKQVTVELETMLQGIDRNILVLFHSKELLQGVYNQIYNRKNLKQYSLLAQDISGSKSKILKQFKKTKRTILFGADTFFEGIDLPGDLLEVVILTKLPFDSPEMPIVKNEHKHLKEEGVNIFMEDLLPRAVLKTKQAFGRLIRSDKDKGVFIILDDRFVTANYGKVFQNSLPDDLSIDFEDLENIGPVVENFLNDPNEE